MKARSALGFLAAVSPVLPVPPKLCTITLEDAQAGRFFEFYGFPLAMLN